MIIRFKNWQKYNGRKDVEFPSWFRMHNGILQDSKIYSLDSEEFRAFIYLLCEASKSGVGELNLIHEHAQRTSRVCIQSLDRCIKKLQQFKIVEIRTLRGRYADVANKQTNRQTERERKKTPPPIPLKEFTPINAVLYERNVSIASQEGWLKLYKSPGWIIKEVNKAIQWEIDNPKHKKKNFATFISNWLSRAEKRDPPQDGAAPPLVPVESSVTPEEQAAMLKGVFKLSDMEF